MKVLTAFDNFVAKLLHKPLRIMCHLTGKNNYFFARLFIAAGAYFSMTSGEGFHLGLAGTSVALFGYIYLMEMANNRDEASDARVLSMEVLMLFIARLTFLVAAAVSPFTDASGVVVFAGMAIGCYFATDVTDPKGGIPAKIAVRLRSSKRHRMQPQGS